ncbi:DUF5076 domain-containing protein [Dyella mobilis]|uniref:DUF5076 domain-containing protein n=1 Tax=Dyella mobilis TaxID=1849582 RepID=A0ABS2KHK6_9GAMM|nr:DUF5076 domain-containing protein [Dyella mobilis]MBM7130656.1 DUF5076 domain-containing protein [Dyella mobilis]GLQ97280.1 DUF5076 domain-containing protein [Dyella mobilis]
MLKELLVPPSALDDPHAVEMVRVWIAQGKLESSIKVGMYAESTDIAEDFAWGVILADLARHISNALQSGYGFTGDVLERIKTSFLDELGAPTSAVQGAFVDEGSLQSKDR